ncbi:MAG: hypothetical protein MJ170_04310 [Alphaproteobacteria bacterium]|nr:hypothetical protein [Alphaproteobacteria bacterium]
MLDNQVCFPESWPLKESFVVPGTIVVDKAKRSNLELQIIPAHYVMATTQKNKVR